MKDEYQSWIDYTDALFTNEILKKNSFPPYLLNLYGLMVLKKLDRPDNKVTASNHSKYIIYRLVVYIRFLENLLNWFESSKYSSQEIEDTCKQLVGLILTEINKLLDRLPNPLPFSYDPICEKLRFHVREWLFLEGPFKNHILLTYWQLWKNLFTNQQLREEEMSFAKTTQRKSNPLSSWKIAYIFQLLLVGSVDNALARLEKLEREYIGFLFPVMDYYLVTNNMRGIYRFVPFLLKHLPAYLREISYSASQNAVRALYDVYQQFAEKTNRYDDYEKILIAMLPFSTRELSSFYFTSKQYRKLLDFIQLKSTISMNNEMIRVIQKEEPELLLPYYHRSVQYAIEQKNRQSYKEAVRHLKKLRTIYKKMKQEELWSQFLQQLLQDTKRLRAFQEECQRGKLIDVENETA